MSRSILIMAGGTGGHIMPGLAVAAELRAAGWAVTWLGGRGGMEERLVPPTGMRTEWVRVRALRGQGLLATALFPLHLLVSFWQCARALRRVRPDVVLGMGGYVAFPGAMMAALLGHPLALHEQNAIAGMANRVLARLADAVMCAFPDALRKAEWTGNPVRAEIAAVAAPAERFRARSGPLRVLVLGGSQGARALNEALPDALALLAPDRRPRVVHQAGERNLEALRARYAACGLVAQADGAPELVPFIDDMATRYAEADLVICRAGAMTVAELAAAGVAAVLVPFPYAVDDHQRANARFLADRGAAVLLPQTELTPARLAELLGAFDRARLLEMATQARALGKPDAARVVARRCAELAGAAA